MKKIIVLLLCCLALVGCGGNKAVTTTAQVETEEDRITLPYSFEIENKKIKLSNIIIKQEKTEHGYDGWLAIELDFSDMNEDERYWFEKEYAINVKEVVGINTDTTIGLNDFSESSSQINESGKKYIFFIINEVKKPLSDMEIALNVDIWKDYPGETEISIRGKCKEYEVVVEFSEDILQEFYTILEDK